MTRTQTITAEQAATLLSDVSCTVKAIMSRPPFDSSHDFHHIERVLRLAETLTADEVKEHPQMLPDRLLIRLAALLHDIGDKKYILTQMGEGNAKIPAPTAESILLMHSAPPALASTVQLLVTNVSFTNEKKHPEKVLAIIHQHPELAIVQDADRLDALGAVGVARAFVFNGVRGESLSEARNVLETHLLPREGAMKTVLGKKMAKERCDYIRDFMARWDDEEAGR